MPVFARTKLLMEEPCFTLPTKLELTYTGPNPQKAYQKIMDLLITDLKVPRENIQEKEFKWDRTKVPETFIAGIEAFRDYDKFSYLWLRINTNGSLKPSKEFGKEGTVKVVVDARVRTEYPQDTVWERSFLYEMFRTFWHKIFYQEQRQIYLKQCRDSALTLFNELKSFFNILKKA